MNSFARIFKDFACISKNLLWFSTFFRKPSYRKSATVIAVSKIKKILLPQFMESFTSRYVVDLFVDFLEDMVANRRRKEGVPEEYATIVTYCRRTLYLLVLGIMLHPNKYSQKIYKTNISLYFHITKDICFTIDVSMLQVLPEYHVSKFRPFDTR